MGVHSQTIFHNSFSFSHKEKLFDVERIYLPLVSLRCCYITTTTSNMSHITSHIQLMSLCIRLLLIVQLCMYHICDTIHCHIQTKLYISYIQHTHLFPRSNRIRKKKTQPFIHPFHTKFSQREHSMFEFRRSRQQ